MKIVLASNNPHKIKEIRAILRRDISDKIELLSLADIGFSAEIAETGATFEENALSKPVRFPPTGYPSMADDSGLEVEALKGAPGVHSAAMPGNPVMTNGTTGNCLRPWRVFPRASAPPASFR